jgi:hypothetical protein
MFFKETARNAGRFSLPDLIPLQGGTAGNG